MSEQPHRLKDYPDYHHYIDLPPEALASLYDGLLRGTSFFYDTILLPLEIKSFVVNQNPQVKFVRIGPICGDEGDDCYEGYMIWSIHGFSRLCPAGKIWDSTFMTKYKKI